MNLGDDISISRFFNEALHLPHVELFWEMMDVRVVLAIRGGL